MKNKKYLFSIFSLCLLLLGTLLFSGCFKKKQTGPTYELTLEVWGVFDDSDAFKLINSNFKDMNPRVKEVKYRRISSNAEEFEKELIDAFASGNGPDVLFFKSSWLSEHGDKIAPLPNSASKLAYFKETFPDVAYNDFVNDNSIYAMPLYNDTLALFYNKDLLNQAGISAPPKTWSEVKDQTKILTKIDSQGNINRSAIALGRSKDPGGINRACDILMLMMLQGGTKMNDNKQQNKASFNTSLTGSSSPGQSALNFYTQFSQANSEVYTWNSKMDYSVDSFRYGRTAMMLNYSYWAQRLKEMDPKLNFDVAPAPQLELENKVNYGIYWGLGVAKNKNIPADAGYTNENRIEQAWNYITFVTTKPAAGATFDPTKTYLEETRKPAARRDLIQEQKGQPVLGVFAEQALTAKTWVQLEDSATEEIFSNMIDEVISGKSNAYEAITTAESRFNNLIK